MNTWKITAALAVGLLLPIAAHADPCAQPNGGSSDGQGVSATYTADVSAGTGGHTCNVNITFGAAGAITTAISNAAGSYDSGGDDNLVGVINNSGHSISSINLSSTGVLGEDIFGFDGDGICSTLNSSGGTSPAGGYTFVGGGNPCSASTAANGQGYGPAGVTFTNIVITGTEGTAGFSETGTVNFATAIASGGTGFFSLEDPVSLSALGVNPTPEPSSLILLGTGALGLAGSFRRRFMNAAK